ncbi:MAG: GlxA family transcriptional regulator [Granulosicoccus sp.]|nr:GlxA family transcriptional regulator [Granulosicoccus sp.]
MDTQLPTFAPFKVGFVLIDGFALMSYASAVEPLRAANLISGQALYEVRNLPGRGARAQSSCGASVSASAYPGEQVDFDLVLVVAGGELTDLQFPQMYQWLRLLASRDVLIGGVSGGPLLLACAGVMNGRRMTVHWEHAARIVELCSDLVVERTLYTRDRDRLTCAGGTAALDMMQALIAEQHGASLAHRVRDWFVHSDVRPGEDPQRPGIAERFELTDTTVIRAVQAMENHIADPLALSQIAGISDVSERQLNRLFRKHLHTTTLDFYRRLRLEHAKSLIVSTSLPFAMIAQSTGFANGAHLSRLFRGVYGLTPTRCRANVYETD